MRVILFAALSFFSLIGWTEVVEIESSGISFDAPDDFFTYDQKLIDIKWPQKRAPRWVVGNESGSSSIAYDLKPNDISLAPLNELMDYFKSVFDRVIPGIDWKKREIIEVSGKKWIYLEMTSSAIDTDIHNIMLVTSYGKEMLVFNFNSTKEDFSKYESQLRKSVSTIKLP